MNPESCFVSYTSDSLDEAVQFSPFIESEVSSAFFSSPYKEKERSAPPGKTEGGTIAEVSVIKFKVPAFIFDFTIVLVLTVSSLNFFRSVCLEFIVSKERGLSFSRRSCPFTSHVLKS